MRKIGEFERLKLRSQQNTRTGRLCEKIIPKCTVVAALKLQTASRKPFDNLRQAGMRQFPAKV